MTSTVGLQSARPPAASRRPELTGRQRFLNACRGRKVDHPPLWMMRQAGRVLPEYRTLKQTYSFLELVRTPELAAEVTLQPIRRFDFDAAIFFSDILVIPEALGQPYRFRETGGVEMAFALRGRADIEKLATDGVSSRLRYVPDAIRLLKPELGTRTGLIGFAGSPWTLANFMLEGGSSRAMTRGLDLLRNHPADFNLLMEKLTQAVISFLQLQVHAGVDALQLFDSHGGLLPEELFEAGSGRWMKKVISALEGTVPVIVFSKGARNYPVLGNLGADVLGIDHGTTLTEARAKLPPRLALQGNLDPAILLAEEPELARRETLRLLREMQDRDGYIFNLGHGVPPTARLENIAAVIETVRSFS